MNDYKTDNIFKRKIPILMSCYYIVCMLYSLHAYMFWHIDNTIITLVIFAMSVGVHLFYSKYYSYRNKKVALFLIFAVLMGTHGNMNNYIFNVINVFPFMSFLFLTDTYKYRVFYVWRNVFLVIISISLVCYILVIAGVSVPYIMDFYGDTSGNDYYVARNYFILIQLSSKYTDSLFERFQSIFLEPGYLACLLVMIFYIDKFKFKEHKGNIILFIAFLLTFSIAGYLLFVVFYMIRKMKDSKYKILSIVGVSCLVSGVYLYGTLYNGGDNEVNRQVIERLQYDSERGTIEGYNRTTEAFDAYFDDFIFSSKVIMGDYQGYERLFKGGGPNVGIKYYIVVYGLLGLLAYCLFLYSPFCGMVKKNYFTLSFMLLWFIIFARGNYVMWMNAFLIIYIFGLISIENERNTLRNKKGNISVNKSIKKQ